MRSHGACPENLCIEETSLPARLYSGGSLVATAVLSVLAGSAIWALLQANNYASITRLYTGAETAAQNQIDVIMTDGPFNPQYTPPQVPDCLALGISTPQTVTIYNGTGRCGWPIPHHYGPNGDDR